MAPDHRPQPAKNKLQEWFPNTRLPVIISAPMKGVATGTLAGQVSKAGGFGKSYIYHIISHIRLLTDRKINKRLHSGGS